MTCRGLLAVSCVVLIAAGGAEAEGRRVDLRTVISTLDLTDRGAARWLERLQWTGNEGPAERLLAVNLAGEPLLEINGDRSSVHVSADLDRLLIQAGRSIILVHNHPSNVGLSAADIGQLAKGGVAAIVAVAHDRSVFVAMRGEGAHAGVLIERQYQGVQSETQRRLRTALADGVPVADADAHLNHLVCRALNRAGVLEYWAELRGPTHRSYEAARMPFGRVVEGTAAWARNNKPH